MRLALIVVGGYVLLCLLGILVVRRLRATSRPR